MKIGVVEYSSVCRGNLRIFPEYRKTRTAMMQEIARKRGNFCGVCPVIGRLNCVCLRLRISLRQWRRVGLASAIFHGLE